MVLTTVFFGLGMFTSCNNDDTPIMPEQEQHTEAVNELIWLMDGHSDVKALLEKSIAKAAAANPDRRYNPAQTLAEFYDFVLVFQRDVNVQLLHSGDHLLMGEAYAHLTLTKQ